MNKAEYLKELTELLEEAYTQYQYHTNNNVELAQYYKGRFHAFNTAILVLGQDSKNQDAMDVVVKHLRT